MVFYYTIRGGQCLNEHSHITLAPEDIVCYVGRDKHENEHLIKYGWPGDVWFHVDGLSSAHVYFRLKNTRTVSAIPIDDLPPDSVYDMMQICKNNSISGCKLASCKMVYTPHSNLKKTFDMEAGAVTYHDTKLCRYARCDKDRQRVKELEKTKSADIKVDYYEEMKANERRIIERKKRNRRAAHGEDGDGELMYDPIQDDIDADMMKAGRQGDASSGLDAGLEALEGMSLGTANQHNVGDGHVVGEHDQADERPLWVREEESRRGEPSKDVRFLRERGYTSADATVACCTTKSRIEALSKLYNATGDDGEPSPDIPEEVTQARIEEKEVLLAMFGFADEDDDAAAKFSDMDDETKLDVSLPVTGYEPPERYACPGPPPQLMLEVYVDNGISPLYPSEPPVLAVVGGGLPEARLKGLTDRIRAEALERCSEEPGEPQVFNLISFAAEAAEDILQKEEAELLEEMEKQKALEAEEAAKRREELKAEAGTHPTGSGADFASEAERRAYAMEVAARAGGDASRAAKDEKKKAAPKFNPKTGVSDRDLCNDLFA